MANHSKTQTIRGVTVSKSEQHCAFTDLTFFDDRLFVVFRQAKDHMSNDGCILVVASKPNSHLKSHLSADDFDSISQVSIPDADLRDPKITVSKSNQLILLATAKHHHQSPPHQSYLWQSKDGVNWFKAAPIAKQGEWLWRFAELPTQSASSEFSHLGMAYSCNGSTPRYIRTYRLDLEKVNFSADSQLAKTDQYPNEQGLCFDKQGNAICLLRRDAKTANTAQIGVAVPPFKTWTWKDLGERVGGPVCEFINDRLIAVVRKYNDELTNAWIEIVEVENHLTNQPKMTTLHKIESNLDCSYAGMQVIGEQLFISYYTTEDDRTLVKVAKLDIKAL